MAWALALVMVIGVGLPVAAWLITRRLPPPRVVSRSGAGYDSIGRWLLDQYQLFGEGLLMFAGVMRAVRSPGQIRRNAAKAPQLNQDSR